MTRSTTDPPPKTTRPDFTLREPAVEDGASVWELVEALDGLEANTLYAYLLFAQDFAATCRVAEGPDGIRGLVVGYRIPSRPDTLFVWQVGVHPAAQGKGLAARMILDILRAGESPPFRFLEATVAEGNRASRNLFEGLARALDAPCDISEGFTSTQFHPQEHPPEPRFRIGPFRRNP
jgi:L-2,4-diaminobutyric acid acetyltransferase